MPYKDKETKKKHDRDDKRRMRGTTTRDDTLGTTKEGIELFEGKPRFITLSDGQIWDRAKVVEPTNLEAFQRKYGRAMEACNRANETDLSRGMSKAKRLALIDRT